MQALEKIKQVKNSTDLIEKQIADTLVENYEIDSFLRSKEIANQLNISKSVLTNFSKKMGYEGYTELYYRLMIEKEFYSNKVKVNQDKWNEYFIFARQIVYIIEQSKSKCFILNSSENTNTNLKLLAHNLRKKGQVFCVDDRKIEKEYFKQVASNDVVVCFYSGLENEELHNNLKILSKISKNVFIITTNSHCAHLRETISKKILVLDSLEGPSSSIRNIQRSIEINKFIIQLLLNI